MSTTKGGDAVTHPPHYNAHPGNIECIEVVRHMGFNLGSAVKYLWRADEKSAPIEDLKKAVWYIQDEIAKRERQVEPVQYVPKPKHVAIRDDSA